MSKVNESGDHSIRPSTFEPLSTGNKPAPRRLRAWPLALGLLVLLCLLILFFLLTARSILINVTPDVAVDIDIDGFYLPFGERTLIRPGNYRLRASSQGFHTLEQELIVGGTQDIHVLNLELQPLPGYLSITTRPSGAALSVDGKAVGQSPLRDLELIAGEHRVRVQAPRYRPREQAVRIEGRERQQSLEIDLEPAWAQLSIDSQPSGANILIDGKLEGSTPGHLDLLEGERELRLELAGYSAWQTRLVIEAGQPRQLGSISLEPAAGVLSLDSEPSSANVTLDGNYRGQTPLTLELIPQTEQRISLSHPGYRRYSETLSLAAGEREQRRIPLTAELGDLQLDVSPARAEVRVNGKLVGSGSQRLRLPTAKQKIDISLDGYATQHLQVTPRVGLEQQLSITLKTVDEARMARLSPELTTALGQTLKLFVPGQSPLHEFSLGASRREPGRRANEVLRPVSLQRMFYMQTTEVSNAQFRQFQAEHNSGQIEGNSLNREHQPVARVSWQQAARFCNWLSRKEGLPPFYEERQGIVSGYRRESTGYRLPTEAEWAWAARAEADKLLKFSWGEEFPPPKPVANYADNTSAYVTGRILNGYTDGHVVSATVASFEPNSKGLYDLDGNVAEWVHDVYQIAPANAPREQDPLGAQNGDNYVIRGASWALSKLSELRLSYRDYGQAGRDDVGFRLARYAE